MKRVLVAVRAFFCALFSGDAARRIEQALAGVEDDGKAPRPSANKAASSPAPPTRSEALTLLATLQREARLIDFFKEPLDGYSDAQIGAAVRDVHRDCRAVLERLFAIEPLVAEEEGAAVEVPAGFEAGKYRLTGNVTGQPPFHGTVTHPGWVATRCDLPSFSGSKSASRVIAPIEVEV